MNTESEPSAPETHGFTLQVYVPQSQTAAARSFYSRLLGRDPEFEPHDDFFEWAPIAGQECWFQVAGHPEASPLTNRVRFRVFNLSEAMAFLDSAGVSHSEPSQLPGVVAFVDFADPWGNWLGYYEDLVPSGEQQTYRGSSVNDATLFTSHSSS